MIFYLSLILLTLRLIPRRLERRTYSYQKHTLPIKLRNLVNLIRKALNSGKSRALRLELRIWSLKLPILPIKLYSFFFPGTGPQLPLLYDANRQFKYTVPHYILLSSAHRKGTKKHSNRHVFVVLLLALGDRKRDDLNIQVLKHNI